MPELSGTLLLARRRLRVPRRETIGIPITWSYEERFERDVVRPLSKEYFRTARRSLQSLQPSLEV